MSTIAHLSDLHFGAEDPKLIEPLLADIDAQHPTLVVISGDLTQRARASQFVAARAFLARIRQPVLVVPGNHDIPLYDVLRRFMLPLDRYVRYITNEFAPTFTDGDLAVLGLNTARSNTWKSGRISHGQIEAMRAYFSKAPASALKILVTHHPFIPPPNDPESRVVGRGPHVLDVAEALHVDVVLAGHLHVGFSGDARTHYVSIKRSIFAIQAGTALSFRTRDEANAYNVITVHPPQLSVTVRAWDGKRFAAIRTTRVNRQGSDWIPAT